MAAEKPRNPPVPAGLSDRAKRLWRAVLAAYEFSPAEVELLRRALVALDRADEAARVLKRDGITVSDRFGGIKQHPAVDVETRSTALFARLVKQLGIELEDEERQVPGVVSRRAKHAADVRWNRDAARGLRSVS
jgi:P27 family predicted phage terminase small subunit